MQEYHSFKVELATKLLDNGKQVGVENAIFLQDIAYWCDYNKSSGADFIDGRYWTFSTMEELSERHPYWTQKQLRRIITNCEESGLLISGNYNQNAYDRTKWYTVSDDVIGILSGKLTRPNGQIHLPKWANGKAETGKCLKYNNTNTETKIIVDDDTRAREETDNGLGRVMTLYFDHIDSFPSQTSREMLKGYVSRLGPDVCERAIERAIDAGARKWTYIHAILKNCEKDGIRSIADWEKKEAKYSERNKKKSGKPKTFAEMWEQGVSE